MSFQSDSPSLTQGARIQARVLRALMIRELLTRFGRDNVGYLWFLIEPLMLAAGITIISYYAHYSLPEDLDPLLFHIIGYIAYMMFRTNVNRSTGLVLSNRVLMYHRHVTMLDLVLSSTILEFIATTFAMILFLALFYKLGLAPIPAHPLLVIAGMAMMWWFTTGLALIVCAAVEFSSVVERFVHPATYLALPFSGMFFRIEWIPEPARDIARWLPMPQIIDIIRVGVWGDLSTEYIYPLYLVAWCGGLTFIGLLALSVARSRVHFD